ncbi:MAG: acyltransferase family protein [Actinobacteria bacterium]|nr:acyltransferase family protein [Actinomycetota bacterium]
MAPTTLLGTPRPSRDVRRSALGVGSEPAAAPSSPAGGRGRPRYLPALDGLRAVAVAAVIAFHLGRLGGGFLGVDVFFVLSGFLITRLLLAERASSERISLKAFWRRRVRRLVPAVLTLLPFVALMSRLWLPSWRLQGIRDDALASLFYVANWRFVASGQSYFAQGVGPSPLRHMWSLAVEEQFYVIWPLLVLAAFALWPRHRVRGVAVLAAVVAAVVAAVSAGWMAWAAGHGIDLTRLYYGTDSRIFAMAAGAGVATFVDRWRDRLEHEAGGDDALARSAHRTLTALSAVSIVALALVGVAMVVGREDEVGFYRGGFQSVAVLAALVVTGLAADRGVLVRALSVRPLRWIGQRSYSIYLWSWPVQVLGRARFTSVTDWRFDLGVVVVTVVLASISYALVERPVMAGRWPFQLRSPAERGASASSASSAGGARWARPAAAALSVSVVAALLVVSAAGAPPEPDYLSVDDDAVVSSALSDQGFASAGDAGDQASARAVVPAPADTGSTATTDPFRNPSLSSDDVHAPPPLDPGPAPPFDPAASVVVSVRDDIRPSSVFGRPLRTILVGDSVGWSIAWGLHDALLPEIDVQDRALIGCGSVTYGGTWGFAGGDQYRYYDTCVDQEQAEQVGFDQGPDVALMWIGAWEVFDQQLDGRSYAIDTPEYASMLRSDIQRRVDRARERGIAFLLPVVPCFGISDNPVHNERRRDTDAVAWVNEQIRAVAEHNPGWVRLIDPGDVLCDADGEAYTSIDGVTVRQDGSHFDRVGATWFWNAWLGRAVASAFPGPTASG